MTTNVVCRELIAKGNVAQRELRGAELPTTKLGARQGAIAPVISKIKSL